jgi:hypothetical protein
LADELEVRGEGQKIVLLPTDYCRLLPLSVTQRYQQSVMEDRSTVLEDPTIDQRPLSFSESQAITGGGSFSTKIFEKGASKAKVNDVTCLYV